MKLKWIASAAFAVALAPAVVLAQSKTATADTSKTSTAKQTTTTSTGDVSSSNDLSKNVTEAMIKAQDDPNLIGSPAWWKTHATADGKPLSSKNQTGKP